MESQMEQEHPLARILRENEGLKEMRSIHLRPIGEGANENDFIMMASLPLVSPLGVFLLYNTEEDAGGMVITASGRETPSTRIVFNRFELFRDPQGYIADQSRGSANFSQAGRLLLQASRKGLVELEATMAKSSDEGYDNAVNRSINRVYDRAYGLIKDDRHRSLAEFRVRKATGNERIFRFLSDYAAMGAEYMQGMERRVKALSGPAPENLSECVSHLNSISKNYGELASNSRREGAAAQKIVNWLYPQRKS